MTWRCSKWAFDTEKTSSKLIRSVCSEPKCAKIGISDSHQIWKLRIIWYFQSKSRQNTVNELDAQLLAKKSNHDLLPDNIEQDWLFYKIWCRKEFRKSTMSSKKWQLKLACLLNPLVMCILCCSKCHNYWDDMEMSKMGIWHWENFLKTHKKCLQRTEMCKNSKIRVSSNLKIEDNLVFSTEIKAKNCQWARCPASSKKSNHDLLPDNIEQDWLF